MNIFKPIALTLMTALILTSSSNPKDKDDHSLVALWKEYYSAESADKPKTQEGILEKIKKEAKAKHLTWDFYDASVRLAQVRISGNWKLRDAEMAARDKDIKEFGEPIAEFFLKNENYGQNDSEKKTFTEQHKERLLAAHNPEFYKRDWRLTGQVFGKLLPNMLANDYEYCLWNIGDAAQLKEEFKTYPLSAFAEFQGIDNWRYDPKSKDSLKEFAHKWEGKAAGLLAEQALLSIRFNELNRYESNRLIGTSADFEALRDDCKALNQKKSQFKGDEKKIADCCTLAGDLLDQMGWKSINANVMDSKLTVCLRNLDAVTMQVLKDKEKIWEKYLTNPYKSYYIEDKLLVELPDLPDGSYTVKCFRGDETEDIEWQKYTISASIRQNADGMGVWATDYVSGEPLKKVDIELLKDDKVIEKTTLTLNGYTPLPATMTKKGDLKKERYRIVVRSGQRASKPISLYYWERDYTNDTESLRAILMTDRGAYNPEDTLHFKAVLYKGIYNLMCCGKGVNAKIELYDTENKLLDSRNLTTNEFGSVAGDIVLKRSKRGGIYHLKLICNGTTIANRGVRVDEFVLPTFDLIFEKHTSYRRPLEEIHFRGRIYSYSGHSLSAANISYKVQHQGSEWASGPVQLDKDGNFDVSVRVDTATTGYDWYLFNIKVIDATGETMEWTRDEFIIGNEPQKAEKALYRFSSKEGDGESEISVTAGTLPVWMVVEAHGSGNKLLWKRVEHFTPTNGFAETTVRYRMKQSDPEVVLLSVIYFQNKRGYRYDCEVRREDHRYDLPLTFSRFLDTTSPGAAYTFEIKTLAGVECASTVFDKSTERFAGNNWSNTRAAKKPLPFIPFNSICGLDESNHRLMIRGLGKNAMMSKAAGTVEMTAAAPIEADYMVNDSVMEEEAIPFQLSNEGREVAADVPIRENFANTIAWEPFLRSDKDGNISFSFTNADKLSTYYVQIFAHDKQMRNETLRREMVVTIPVKISLVEPQFLYEGDKYIARIALSSSISKDLKGTLSVQLLDGTDHKTSKVLRTASCKITVPAKGGASQDFVLDAPAVENLGIKAVFVPDSGTYGSDGVFVTVPVKQPVQTLTEAHSAVLLSGADKAALEAELRAMFENVDGSIPELQEIDIRQMLRDALPTELKPECDNAISLARALYAWSLCRKLGLEPEFDREDAVKKLLACKNADGGFGWFVEMSSSPLVTAVVLRLVHGLGIVDEAAAVQYIDSRFFAKEKVGWWYRGLSLQQYLHTRSLFPEVAFKEKTDADFRKDAKAYLVPKKERGLNGWIAAKARRVQTLENLLNLDGGVALASKLGIKLGTARKLRKSLAADIESLVEYAQPHKSGGVYYPNAVMPWRGLLETELDAHCALAEIMDEHAHFDISNGIRLWIMLQKETQDWKQQSGYIEALGMVLNGPEDVLDTKVLALKAEYTLPFEKIRASGNGMTITAIPATTVIPSEAKESIGDRMKLSYTITNEENRSFVKVTIPFGAGLIPVNQLSGYRWNCYRNVLADRIELWYEVYPEEKTTVTEEFYVTRAGSFQAPVATIECEYAPHYRANDAWNGCLEISAK